MSIVRVGLAETKNFSDGYDLIFGKKEEPKKEEERKELTPETQSQREEKAEK